MMPCHTTLQHTELWLCSLSLEVQFNWLHTFWDQSENSDQQFYDLHAIKWPSIQVYSEPERLLKHDEKFWLELWNFIVCSTSCVLFCPYIIMGCVVIKILAFIGFSLTSDVNLHIILSVAVLHILNWAFHCSTETPKIEEILMSLAGFFAYEMKE